MPIPSFRHIDDSGLDPEAEALAGAMLGCARQVYRELGPGLSEGIYHEATEIALDAARIPYVSKPRTQLLRADAWQRHPSSRPHAVVIVAPVVTSW